MNGLPITQVVVPVDFSEASFRAVDIGLQIAGDPTRLHVIHVLQDATAGHPGLLMDVVGRHERLEKARHALSTRLDRADYHGIHVAVVFGDPRHEIVQSATTLGADLIVMPSHSKSIVAQLLVGSVAERVVQLAPCPVLVLRDED